MRSLAAAVLGGLPMGYGAHRLSAAISASSPASPRPARTAGCGSAAALAGSWIGVRLRPRFGLAN
ncbi:MAG: hypothetical protein M5R42_10515 [Rhodocyclaceae bacterium]|nr:hypothetical protein [Rhodocyclaceae bacterium]